MGLKIEGFTPGPWRVDPRYPDDVIAPDGADVVTAWTEGGTGPRDGRERVANARLIAAAPTLWNHLLDLEEEVDKAARRIKVMEQDHAAEVAGLRSELEDKKS